MNKADVLLGSLQSKFRPCVLLPTFGRGSPPLSTGPSNLPAPDAEHPLTSVGAEEGVVGDGAWLGKGVEFVEPLPGDVELQQTRLLHGGQGDHLLALPHRLLAALPGRGDGKERGGGSEQSSSQPLAFPAPCLKVGVLGGLFFTFKECS